MKTIASKTFAEIKSENPNLYDGCVSYHWSEAHQRWDAVALDDATKELIDEWFSLRVVCNDEHFIRFFRRGINVNALRYAQLARIELSSFDPLVSWYRETQREGMNSSTSTGQTNENKTLSGTNAKTSGGGTVTIRTPNLTYSENENIDRDNSETHSDMRVPNLTKTENGIRTPSLTTTEQGTRTPNLTEATSGSDSGTSSTNKTSSGREDRHGEAEAINKTANKQAPQSISYNSGSGGTGAGGYNTLPGLDWHFMTAQAQADNASEEDNNITTSGSANESTNHNNTNSETKRTSGQESTNATTRQTGTEQTNTTTRESGNDQTTGSKITIGSEDKVGRKTETGTETTRVTLDGTASEIKSGQENKQGTDSRVTSGSDKVRERTTGRNDMTPQEAFKTAVSYLKTSSAWEWMYRQLDQYFLAVYDI